MPEFKTLPIKQERALKLCSIDFSIEHLLANNIDISSPALTENYVRDVLEKHQAYVAYGGYLEKRNIYQTSDHFNNSAPVEEIRNIHLGIDFWAPGGTKVIAPFKGKVHSFANNNILGDYGPTIILEHETKNGIFYTLYGHLSLDSLKNLEVGDLILPNQKFASFGGPEVNGNYAPHLHFQVIFNLEGMHGDYPGVCCQKDLAHYSSNCPDPMEFIKRLE